MILDTSFLIDVMNGDEGAVDKARDIERGALQQWVSSMTLFELYYGVTRSITPGKELEKVEEVLESKPSVPADSIIMRKAGGISGDMENNGTPIDDADAIIAATASIKDEPVLTRNTADFSKTDIEIESY